MRWRVNVNVQVQVVGNCSVSAPSTLACGTPAPAAIDQPHDDGQVTLTCNRGAAPLVAVSNGNNFGTTRNMANGGNLVAYAVKQSTISGTDYTNCPAFGGGSAWELPQTG